MSSTVRFDQRQDHQQVPALIGTSREASSMRDFARTAAKSECALLIRGETGTGKDNLAEFIHHLGRRDRDFVPVICEAMMESVFETELFGHTQGAFTDARAAKPGLVQVASEGTLFFNEVGYIPLNLQAKFLRVLERKTFRAIGGTQEIHVNARIIAATNANLEAAVQCGRLRSDLYHRLNAVTCMMAPLRDHRDDIPPLVEHFLRRQAVEKKFSPETMSVMIDYYWPGNIRELKNAVERAVFRSDGTRIIQPEHVRPYLTGVGGEKFELVENTEGKFPTLQQAQQNYFRVVLKRANGNMIRAAKIAGIARNTMYNKVQEFQLQDFAKSLKEQV